MAGEEIALIVEQRVYTLRPGSVPEYLRLYEAEGLAIQRPILGHLVGYFSSEIGPLNQIVHMWAYRDLGDRGARRDELARSPAWQAFRPKTLPLIASQENRILVPARFSPYATEVPEG